MFVYLFVFMFIDVETWKSWRSDGGDGVDAGRVRRRLHRASY